MSESKTILLVTHSWPPDTRVGAVRSVNVLRALKTLGWQATVLTVLPQYYQSVQQKNTEEYPVAEAVRTRCCPTPLDGYRFLRRWTRSKREDLQAKADDRPREGDTTNHASSTTVERGWIQQLRCTLLSLLHTPDEEIGWWPFAVWAGAKLVVTRHISCMVTTGPPFTDHVIGLAIKLLTSVRWVVEFRDPWVENPQKDLNMKSRVGDWCDAWLERAVVRHADKVVCVTRTMASGLSKRYPEEASGKWASVSNGFDQREFAPYAEVVTDVQFTIAYLGGFVYSRSPRTLLHALQGLLSKQRVDREMIKVRFIGQCRFAMGRSVQAMIDELGLTSVVEIVDRISRVDALRTMREAHLLLLLAADQPNQIPAKTFEYIAAARPLLVETEWDSATADLVQELQCGVIIQPGDVAHMESRIAEHYTLYRNNQWHAGNTLTEAAQQYSWDKLGAQYATLLDELLVRKC